MLVLLEKGRPAAPEGARRQHVQMRKGVPTKVWVKKVGKKWVYDGTVNTKRKVTHVGERSLVRKEAEKEIGWIVGDVPTIEQVKTSHLKEAIRANDGKQELPKEIADYFTKEAGVKITSLSDIQNIGTGEENESAYLPLYNSFGTRARQLFMNHPGGYMAYFASQSLLGNSRMLTALSDPMFDGQMDVDNMYPSDSNEFGLRFTMITNTGMIPNVTVSWDQLDAFVDTWSDSKREADAVKRAAKKSDGYKQWQVTGDPEISGAVADLEKATGMDVAATSFYGRGQTQLKKAYITKITKTFNTLKAGVDLSKYTPPDGKKLKIRVTGATGKAAGFYTEHDNSINIAPSLPGTISHEVGHYLWERHPAMQKEFMDWVKDSGLMDKIEKQTKGKMSPAEKSRHIDYAMNTGMKVVLEQMSQPAGPQNTKYYLQPHAIDGLRVLTNILRQNMQINSLGPEWLDTPVKHIKSMADGDLQSLAQAAVTNGMYPNQDPVMLGTQLKALRDGVSLLNDVGVTTLGNQLSMTLKLANNGKPPSDRRFRTQASYWEKPTEMFARTFRNYVAMKDGQKIYSTASEQNRSMTDTELHKNPHGWGFPEIDPSVEMLNFDNNRLQQILKHHIGGTVMKAMLDNISKSRHSDLATQLAEEGLYKDGMAVDFDADELAAGIKVEMEHTTDPAVAEEVAKDHLVEDDKYYSKLKEIEKAGSGDYGEDDDDEDEEGSERDQAYEREAKNEAAKDENEEAKVQKSSPKVVFVLEKAKYTRRFMKDGKWQYVYADDIRKKTDRAKEWKKHNTKRNKTYGDDVKMDFKTMSDDDLLDEYFHAGQDAARLSSLGNMNNASMKIFRAQNRVERTRRELERRGVAHKISDKVLDMQKAKPYPNGTVRKHSGRTMIKKDGGWVPASAGEASQTEDKKADKSRKPVKAVGGTPKNTIQGSPEMFTALVKVGGGKAPYLDDLNGKARGIYNSMTKAGLIRWVHLAEEEYRPELTDAGRKALDTGQALTIKTKRDKKTKKAVKKPVEKKS